MLILKKFGFLVIVVSVGLLFLGYLPRGVSHRLAMGLGLVLVLGFVIRVGAYLWQAP